MKQAPPNLLTASWTELSDLARKALSENDLEALQQLSYAFHHLFLHEARRGDESSRSEFLTQLLAIAESHEARQKPRPDPVQRVLAQWEHLCELADAFRRDVDAVEQAAQLVRSREHADRLLREVASSGTGIPAGDLAERLRISPQQLSKLLRELEEHDVIERHPAGRKVYVCLGLAGQLLLEQKAEVLPTPSGEELDRLFADSRILEPLRNPREALSSP